LETEVGKLLSADANFSTMNPFEREDWQTEFESMMGSVNSYYANKGKVIKDNDKVGFDKEDK
jgi:molybdopterin converting factor small subunit